MANKNKSQFIHVSMSKDLLTNSYLSSGSKITMAAIISLANNDGICYARSKVLAKMLNVSVRTIQHHIALLVTAGLVNIEYKGRMRTIRPLISNDNPVCVIPDQVIGLSISASYKLAYGVIAAKGINNKLDGYHWQSMQEFASYLDVSISSAYRYVARLLSIEIVTSGDTRLHLIAMDKWSIKHRKDLKEKPDHKSKVLEKQVGTPPPIDPHVDSKLDAIYKRMN